MCVPVYWICDGAADCPDASDEAGCSCEDWGLVECTGKDNSTQCIPELWALEGHPLCSKSAGNVTFADPQLEAVIGKYSYVVLTKNVLLTKKHLISYMHCFNSLWQSVSNANGINHAGYKMIRG